MAGAMPGKAGGIRAGYAFVEIGVLDRVSAGLSRVQSRLRAFAATVQNIGMQMGTVALMGGLPFIFAGRQFMQFEDAMLAVKAVTGATGKQFDMLDEKARALGRSTSYTAQEVAMAMLNLGQAGFKPKEIDSAIESMLSMARATGTDLAEASDIAAVALRAFNLEADEMGRVADVLTATANNSAQTLSILGDSLKYVAPVAKEFNMSIEESGKALGLLANMGIKGSMAGTSMRQILLRLTDKKVSDELKKQGVAIEDSFGNLRPFADIMLDIGKAMAGMTQAGRLSFARGIFDQRAVAGALKLATADFARLEAALRDVEGVAKRTADEMDSGLGGAFRKALSAAQDVALAIGKAVTPELKALFTSGVTAANWVSKFISKNRELVASVMGAVGALSVASVSLLGFALVLKALSVAIGAFAALWSLTMGAVSIAATAALTAINAAATITTASLTALGISFLTTVAPILAAVAALGLFAVALERYTKVGSAGLAHVTEAFRSMKSVATTALRAIGAALAQGELSAAADVAWASLKLSWTIGIASLKTMWLDFTQWFADIWNTVTKTVMHSLLAMMNWADRAITHAKTAQDEAKNYASMVKELAVAREAYEHEVKRIVAGSTRTAEEKQWQFEYQQRALKAKEEAIRAKYKEDTTAVNERHQERLREADRQFIEAWKGVEEDFATRATDLYQRAEQQRADAAQELKDAQKRWEEAIRQGFAKSQPENPYNHPDKSNWEPGAQQEAQAGAAAARQQLAESTDVRGAFNMAAAFGIFSGLLGGDSLQERIAKTNEEIAANTRRIADDEGEVFA